MRSIAVLLLLGAAAVAVAQEAPAPAPAPAPEPGLIDPDVVDLGELVLPSKQGDATKAHETFLTAHRQHGKGALVEALQGYLDFLGTPGHTALPERYARTARARLESMREAIGKDYAKAVALYRTDRAKGLVQLQALQTAYGMLPEGRAARRIVQSDATRAAVREARSGKPDAAKNLEKAILVNPDSLYLYEAKTLLVKLGGPDLFDPDERIGSDGEPEDSRPDKDDEESVIEIGD